MGFSHSAINPIVAVTLVVIDGAGLVYFYFVDTAGARSRLSATDAWFKDCGRVMMWRALYWQE
jgi:hypothetical protein